METATAPFQSSGFAFHRGFADKEDRKSGRGNRQRNIQQKDRTPGHLIDQPATSTGPAAAVSAPTPAHVPIAWLRSRSSKCTQASRAGRYQ